MTTAARRLLADFPDSVAEKIERRVDELLDAAPPMTTEQRETAVRILATVLDSKTEPGRAA